MSRGRWRPSLLAFVALIALNARGVDAEQVRIKDITRIEGERTYTLEGMGLVTGLAGTGGTVPITREIYANFLDRLGNRTDPLLRANIRNDTKIKTPNVSVVTVTATVPVTARPGQKFDGIVAAFDDAESLSGGLLQMSSLVAVDGKVYATAVGPVSTTAFSFGGQAASVQKNHTTTARLPNGVTIQRLFPHFEIDMAHTRLMLPNQGDWNTASRIADVINQFQPYAAKVTDKATVLVRTPEEPNERAKFLSRIGQLTVEPDMPATVVINERTGTVVLGGHVRLSAVAVVHGNLSVVTKETPRVSQPAPFSEGQTAVVPRTDMEVIEEKKPVEVVPATTTVGELADALNRLGVTPRDISAIFQMLSAQRALHAELVFE